MTLTLNDLKRPNASGYYGVYEKDRFQYPKSPWQAMFVYRGHRYYAGYWATPEQAARAVLRAFRAIGRTRLGRFSRFAGGVCQRGHLLTPENLYVHTEKTGLVKTRCRKCQNDYQRARYRRCRQCRTECEPGTKIQGCCQACWLDSLQREAA